MSISRISKSTNSVLETMTKIKQVRVLGIDPGTVIMGYGVIDSRGEEIALVKYGTFNTPARSPIGERLSYLYRNLLEIIDDYQPQVLAVEQPFVAKNAQSAFAVGRAQAIAILAAANRGLPCYEYTPREIKQRVANYGASSKEQMQQMVRLQLGMTEIPAPDDSADALAVALCHLQSIHVENLLEQQN